MTFKPNCYSKLLNLLSCSHSSYIYVRTNVRCDRKLFKWLYFNFHPLNLVHFHSFFPSLFLLILFHFRELQRIESISNAPIFSHFSETFLGLTTIRAYNQESRFMEILFKRMEENNVSFVILNSSSRWLGIALVSHLNWMNVTTVGTFFMYKFCIFISSARSITNGFFLYLLWKQNKLLKAEMNFIYSAILNCSKGCAFCNSLHLLRNKIIMITIID
jgi:ABC-type multidrug transport system fused ATPase/permease subunit